MFRLLSVFDSGKRLHKPKSQLAVNGLIGEILHIIKQTVNTYGILAFFSLN